jgi:uncharacterized protein (DUF488 family)
MRTLWTVGHGTLDGPGVAQLVAGVPIAALVDVRRYPGSRRNPGVARDALAVTLPEHGITYRWDERLGGRRSRPRESPDTALRHPAFAGYAAHMRTPAFTAAVAELLDSDVPAAVLCSESVWWRCHRRLLGDHLVLVHDVAVTHLMHDGRHQAHRLTDGVRRAGDELVYDAGQQPLPSTG